MRRMKNGPASTVDAGPTQPGTKTRPTYPIESVDHALQLAQLLQQEDSLGVAQAAQRLGVARSTAHRLLAMLVYRDFAEQGGDHRYRAGPLLRRAAAVPRGTGLLREVARPRLHALVARTGETATLQVRVGAEVRFVEAVECDRALRVGDPAGRIVPAHQASGGKALLAALSDRQVADLYVAGDVDLPGLLRELARVRARGFAVNDGEPENGLTDIGVLVRGPDHQPLAALSLALPSIRFDRANVPGYVAALATAATGIHDDLSDRNPDGIP
jgi:IclR family transcriptional regulator, acetate operon repressor